MPSSLQTAENGNPGSSRGQTPFQSRWLESRCRAGEEFVVCRGISNFCCEAVDSALRHCCKLTCPERPDQEDLGSKN